MLSSVWHCCDAAHGLLSLTMASTTHLISTTVAEQDGLSLRNINWEPLKVEPRRSCLTAGATERHRGILHHKPTQSITGLHAEQQACVLGTREELAEECVVESVTRLVRRVPASVRAYDPRTQHTTYHPQRARTTLRRTHSAAMGRSASRRSPIASSALCRTASSRLSTAPHSYTSRPRFRRGENAARRRRHWGGPWQHRRV